MKKSDLPPKIRQLALAIKRGNREQAQRVLIECLDIAENVRTIVVTLDSEVEAIFPVKTCEKLRERRIHTIGDLVSFSRSHFYSGLGFTYQQCKIIERRLKTYDFQFAY